MLLDVDESSDILAIFRSVWLGDKQKLRGFPCDTLEKFFSESIRLVDSLAKQE